MGPPQRKGERPVCFEGYLKGQTLVQGGHAGLKDHVTHSHLCAQVLKCVMCEAGESLARADMPQAVETYRA